MSLFCRVVLFFSVFSAEIFAQEINLRSYEKRLISQNGEDGVIEKIFDIIGTKSAYYVEFGAGDGHLCSNTKYLREKHHWKGLLLDGFYPDNASINLHKEFITTENICELFEKYEVPKEFDLASIDIDGNDFYVWKAMVKNYAPRVVVIECNPLFLSKEDKVMEHKLDNIWLGDTYFGSSVLALYNMGRHLGYSLVYQESSGSNLFFIRDDVLASSAANFQYVNDVEKLYISQSQKLDLTKTKIKFISSTEATEGL